MAVLCLVRSGHNFFENFTGHFPYLTSEVERADEPALRQEILRLSKNFPYPIVSAREAERRYQAGAEPRLVCDHAVECDPLLRSGQRRPDGENAKGARGTLPDLLAADFRLYLPARASGDRCTGSNTGFFCHGA